MTSKSARRIEPSQHRIAAPRSGIVLFNPEITVVASAGSAATHLIATAAEPALRPEAVQTQIDAARSLLSSLADARGVLHARATAVETITRHASSEQERVSAAEEAYRVAAALDDVLTDTYRQLSALMEERGLR